MPIEPAAKPPKPTKAVSNQFGPPVEPLPLAATSEIVTENAIKLAGSTPDPRLRFIFQNLTRHLHEFVKETDITTDEWLTAIKFLTATGQKSTDLRQEFILLSDVLGVSALVDSINNPLVGNTTESSILGPFYTEQTVEIANGDSIASEGKGEYLLVKGRVLNVQGEPIPNAVIDTWETDDNGYYDTQYDDRSGGPDCRGRLSADAEGRFQYRAVVPVTYPIPSDGPVGLLLETMHRHNNRPAHLHLVVEAEGYHKLVTALYPDDDPFYTSDAVFGVKQSLVVKFTTIESDEEARKHGFKKGPFKLLERDIVLATVEETAAARKKITEKNILKNTKFV